MFCLIFFHPFVYIQASILLCLFYPYPMIRSTTYTITFSTSSLIAISIAFTYTFSLPITGRVNALFMASTITLFGLVAVLTRMVCFQMEMACGWSCIVIQTIKNQLRSPFPVSQTPVWLTKHALSIASCLRRYSVLCFSSTMG